MKTLKLTILLFTLFFLGSLAASAVLQQIIPLQSYGQVKGVGVSIQWLTGEQVEAIDWGTIENNTATTSPPFKITNVNNTDCTLHFSTTNHSPNILSLTLTWNYTGAPLAPQQSQVIAFTLTVACSNTEPFTFGIPVIAETL